MTTFGTGTGTGTAQVTLSGRELALQRRQAMALRGKAGVLKSTSAQSGAAVALRPAMALARPTGRTTPAAVATDCGCGCKGAGCATASDAPTALSASSVSRVAGAPAMDLGSTRALARARRVALATDGKKAMLRVAQATRLAAVLPQQDWQQAIEKGASGREVAKQRRLVRALVGRAETSSTAPRPNGRMRAKNETLPAPPKVAIGHTLSGQSVTGTPVDVSRKVTGNEAGACKSVTGTEYLSLEQFSSVCGTRPAPGPAKVAVSSTLREQKVTGTEVGRAARVTGDEAGSCRSVTGTEYLSREQQTVCHAVPAPSPRKVSVMSSQGGQAVSGVEVGRSAKVTGNESGAARQLTGSQYFNATDFGQPAGREAPPKVATVQTLAGSTVTGTEVGLSSKVTGDERGGCRAVTGTEYISAHQQGAVCATTEPVQAVRKVGQDQTWNDQAITGTRVGRSKQVTGDEYGGCAPISGTSYIGRQQYQGFCEPAQLDSQQALSRREALISAATVTGDRPGAGGSAMTGDQRGACSPISGTPYLGPDNRPQQCGTSARFVAPARPQSAATPAASAKDFSIRPPSRQAQERASGTAVTGSAFSGQRITGAANKGGGLITGTPEFRHREHVPLVAPQGEGASAATKLTGEGSQSGARISGAAWQTSDRVTGTEGTSSLARNPSQRGEGRGVGMTALQFRKAERVEQPQSRVTGSSGNTVKGAAVTLSGGARG